MEWYRKKIAFYVLCFSKGTGFESVDFEVLFTSYILRDLFFI